MTIPTEIEKDIKSGKARYQTFQTGIGGQSVLKVPANSYIIIYGYEFSPAGGGILVNAPFAPTLEPTSFILRPFETQQVSFYTGQAFHPFIHHVPLNSAPYFDQGAENRPEYLSSVDNRPLDRQVYIVGGGNVSIQVGLMDKLDEEAAGIRFGPIGVTSNTPEAVTYGGDGNNHAVQSFLSTATGSVFTQPSVEDVDFYSTGFVPEPNAEGQVYLKPELNSAITGFGLIDPSEYILTNFVTDEYVKAYAPHYYLNVHYALYTNQITEQLG